MRWLLGSIAGAVLGSFVVLLAVAVHVLEDRPDLRVWHRAELDAELTADAPIASFAEYRTLEERLFAQLETSVYGALEPADRTNLNRYSRGSLADPARWPADWNRSFEWPADPARAGVLLLHGMSDSPYSMRALGQALHARGAFVVGLRLPGHGTAPSGLLGVRYEDMAAAVRIAVRHLRERVGDAPVHVIGYSNGGALAVHYALAAAEDPELPRVDGIELISPAIGVTRLAGFAVWQARLGRALGLPKLAWSSILPEYDPFKYNSFAVNAGDQVFRLTTAIQAALARAQQAGRLGALPPMLAFQSLVDSTVSTRALYDQLYLRLPADGGHELVAFDLNRRAAAEELLRTDPRPALAAELGTAALPFTLSFLTNEGPQSSRIVLRRKRAGSTEIEQQPLDLEWPRGLFSLSHVALPFSPQDPLNGGPDAEPSPGIQLGAVELRGERGVLVVSGQDLLRLRWNPFYAWLEQRVLEAVGVADQPSAVGTHPATIAR